MKFPIILKYNTGDGNWYVKFTGEGNSGHGEGTMLHIDHVPMYTPYKKGYHSYSWGIKDFIPLTPEDYTLLNLSHTKYNTKSKILRNG